MRVADLHRWVWGSLALLAAAGAVQGADALAAQAHEILRQAFRQERGWTRIHAAEALLAVGDAEVLRAELGGPAPEENAQPERIGIWRVRAGLACTPAERAVWVRRIESVAADAAAKDQLQAIESLAKLGGPPSPAVLTAARRFAEKGDAEGIFPMWLEFLAGDTTAVARITAKLASTVPAARLRAAYVLRRLQPDDANTRQALAHAASVEPRDSMAYPYVLGAALLLGADPAQAATWRARLEELAASGGPGARYEADQVLMQVRPAPSPARFRTGLEGAGDVRIGAAWAILGLAQAH